MEEEIIRKIPFIKKEDKLSIMPYSFSGALTLKIIRNKEKYFLKIVKYFENCGEREEEIEKIFKQLQIPQAKLLEHGKLLEDRYYFIYTFIEGTNLYDWKERTEKFYEKGLVIGSNLKKLKQWDKSKIKYIKTINNKEIMHEAITSFFCIYPKMKQEIDQYFSCEEIEEIHKRFISLEKSFDKEECVLIFGDVKTQNIIIQGEEPILVDYGSITVNHTILNFRHNIDSCFGDKSQISRAFFSGALQGMYENDFPDSFEENMLYLIILKFFSEAGKAYENGKMDIFKQIMTEYDRAYKETAKFTQLKGIFNKEGIYQ